MSKRGNAGGGVFWGAGDEEAAHQRYQTLASAIDDGLYQLDAEGRFVAVNDAFVERLGYAREDFIGEHVSLVLDEADIHAVERAISDLLETGDDVATFEIPVRAADGDTLHCEFRVSPHVVDGEFRGTVGVARDITERQEREQTIREERTLLNRVFAASPIGISALSPDGEIITRNDRAAELVGADPDRQVGETYDASEWEVYDPDGEPIPPNEQVFGTVVDTGEPVTDVEAQVHRRDGGSVWLSFNGVPVFDGDGELSMVVITYEDITERKEHAQDFQRERAQTEQLLRTAPVAILVQDVDGETILANQRAQDTLGLSEQEFIDEPEHTDKWTILDADGEELPPGETPTARVLATGEPVFDEELVIEPPSGERMQFRLNTAPLFDSDGTIERIITAGEDITELKRHEQQLEQRKTELETELSEILGRVSDAFYALDENWQFTHINDQAAEIFQQTEDELLGRSIRELFPEETEGETWEKFQTAMDRQESVTFEQYIEELDGWLEFNVYPSETGLSIYFRDVTERKANEQELAMYETIIETINDAIYVLDDDLQFTMVNEAYTELTGYTRDELLGEHASLVVDADTLEQGAALREQLADGEESNPTLETTIETASDDRVPVEGSVTPVLSSDEGHKRIGVLRDITERKENQRKLEESERRYRTLAEHFPNGAVGLFDEDLCYTAAGGELMDAMGTTPEDRIGTSIYDLYPEDLIEDIEPYFHAALEGEANSFEAEYLDRHLLAYTLPIRNVHDEIDGGMLVVQDITELKATQRQLEESNERLEQFAYAASHDLQEPLRMVSSYLQLVERRYADELDEDGREFIDFAVDGAQRMREMIEGLLQYSRIETQGDSFEPVDLDDILDEVLADLQLQIEESDADITAESLPRVEGDSSQLRQVFQNLLGNAIEYSGDESPRVHIAAERDGTEWVLSIRDEGIGIDPDDADRIFEVFQRLHVRDEHAGTGIGLALCRRIVERHGGDIGVTSEPGGGTTFSFTLPAAGDSDE